MDRAASARWRGRPPRVEAPERPWAAAWRRGTLKQHVRCCQGDNGRCPKARSRRAGAIADALWDSLEHGDDEASVHKAWDDEVARRAKELDEGRAELVDWDDVKVKIANRLGER